ncbi:DUF1768-domain-containing protein [Phlyctema vagabunda]|uniref:DUF1768-domain-containing protein n=1 Tax=Phlyctema vagabunda TaxID=108571 RepID=A0ABR4PBU5_9HELO
MPGETVFFFGGARTDTSPWKFLSQWYPSPFRGEDGSVIYKTAEQYMMHQKALLFSDADVAARILLAETPKEQKALGRQVKNFDEDIWIANRLRIVTEGSYHKFMHGLQDNTDLRDKLLATENRELVEAAPRDKIWGIGFSATNAEKNRQKWGQNLLGKALMEVRDQIREEVKEADARVPDIKVGR